MIDGRLQVDTATGKLLLSLFEDRRAGVASLSGLLHVQDLLSQLFVVAVRRRFCGVDARLITTYVNGMLAACELPSRGRQAREAEALIRTALGEEGLAVGIADRDRVDAVIRIIDDLTGEGGTDSQPLIPMIVEAEKRLARFGGRDTSHKPPKPHKRLWRRG